MGQVVMDMMDVVQREHGDGKRSRSGRPEATVAAPVNRWWADPAYELSRIDASQA